MPKTSVSRRTFTRTLALGAAAAALPGGAARARRQRLKVGHTGITWGFKPTDAEQASRTSAASAFAATNRSATCSSSGTSRAA